MNVPRLVIFIAFSVVVLSAAYSFYYHDRPRVDAQGYDQIGWHLARGNGYIEDEANILTPQKDWGINRVGPGYEFFLAALYFLFGHHYPVVWLFHALLRGLSVILIYRLTRLLLPDVSRAAYGAAILFAFMPDLVVINGLLLTETFFLAVLIGALLFSIKLFENPTVSRSLTAGFFWALTILTRPTALAPFLTLVAIFLWKKKVSVASWLFLFPFIIVGSWSLFASLRYDRFILTTGVGSYDLWVGNNINAAGGFEKAPEVQRARDTLSSNELNRVAKKKYFEFITMHPVRFALLQIRKAAFYFSLLRPGVFWPHLWGRPLDLALTLTLSFFWILFLLLAGTAGAILLWQERNDLKTRFFLFAALLQPLSTIPVIVEARYRYALFPFLAVCAGYYVYRATHPNARRALMIAAAFFFVSTGYDFFTNMSDVIAKITHVIRIL